MQEKATKEENEERYIQQSQNTKLSYLTIVAGTYTDKSIPR